MTTRSRPLAPPPTDKAPAELYEEREARIRAAVELRAPDRVPVVLGGTYFAAKLAGLPSSAVYYDAAAWKEAFKRMVVDFAPDAYGAGSASSGVALEVLGAQQMRWPGGSLPPDVGHQFVEGEYMKAEEYPLLLSDPSDFALRYYLPRVFEALAPLSRLPAPRTWLSSVVGFTAGAPLFATPEFQK